MRSTALGERGTSSLGPWRAAWTALPYQGQAPGGDRFLLARSPTGDLCFVLADAAGHGTLGNALWLRHEATFLAAWRAFVAGCSLADFVDPLDASLCAGEALDSVCLTVGRWQPSGALELSTCGYGTHALVRTAQGPWWAEPEALFGLKLGWFGPERRRELPRGLVQTRLSEVERIVLVSDGVLEDDHRNPEATLASLERANHRCAPLPFAEVLETVLELAPAPAEDDLTVVALELEARSFRG